MTAYAEAEGCRRRILLHYFSDHSRAEAERCCDNCLAQQAPAPAPQDVQNLSRSERAALIILDALQRNGWGIGCKRLAELLRGARTKEMTAHYQHNRHYGKFRAYRQAVIEAWIDHLVTGGHLKIVGGDRPVLALTYQGRAALVARAPISLPLPDDPPSCSPSPATRPSSRPRSADETLHLAREGKNPAEIAATRGLAVSTIHGHLATLIGAGRLELSAVVSEEVTAQVQAVIAQVGDLSRLAPLKERLPDEISYGELRCVVEAAQRQRQELPTAAREE
jgi:superfamily II DNA helicase RecQ